MGRLLPGLTALMLFSLVACGRGQGAEEAAAPGAPAAVADAAEGTRSRSETSPGQDTTHDELLRGEGGGRIARIRVGGVPVTVEVADDAASRERGLMHRDSLPEDHGMLFVYESERVLGFWMKNTRIPLDIAFIDRTGRIVDIQQMEPMTEETHTSRAPAMYALELPKGWFERHGVQVGSQVEF